MSDFIEHTVHFKTPHSIYASAQNIPNTEMQNLQDINLQPFEIKVNQHLVENEQINNKLMDSVLVCY